MPQHTDSSLLALGLTEHRAGRLDRAEQAYRRLLEHEPANADALHLLGLVAHQRGQYEEAVGLIGKACHTRPSADFLNSLGLALEGARRPSEAIDAYRRAQAVDPAHVKTLSNLGRLLLDRGDVAGAVECYRAALARAPGRGPAQARMRNNLGLALRQSGRIEEAISEYREALAIAPQYPEAHNNLGAALRDQGRNAEAIAHFEQAVGARPDYEVALVDLGMAYERGGRPADAIAVLRRTVRACPDSWRARFTLGRVLFDNGDPQDAETALREALGLNPGAAEAWDRLGDVYGERAELEEADRCFARALELGADAGVALKRALRLPPILPDGDSIPRLRAEMDRRLDALIDRPVHIESPPASSGSFFLAYHGCDDRALLTKAARVLAASCPSLAFTAPHCLVGRRPRNRIRVGFVSAHLYQHSIGRTTSGLVANLSRERFEVLTLFAVSLVDDPMSRFIRDSSDRHLVLPLSLQAAREAIAALELDVLFYQDIGLDPFTYALAFSRLAPVQCVSFGHPNTTGIPTLDYFVSCDAFEPEGSASHYSESLFLLRDVPTLAYYYPPRLGEPRKSRARFGLAEGAHIYCCPQSLFKLHPDFDELIGGILRADPDGLLVLVEGGVPYRVRLLRERFQRTIGDVADRVRFLPGQSAQDFLALIAASDVMLDTPHFNGMNTTLEAFAVGTPVVTLPTGFQRGRHTYGMYRAMGVLECVAAGGEAYVRLAVALGTDRERRRAISERIAAARHVLYENTQVVREFERFFATAVAASDGAAAGPGR